MTPRNRYEPVELPCGVVPGGDADRLRVGVRSLTGDEEWLLADRRHEYAAVVATALLDVCVEGLPEGGSAALSVGDREALLLSVRRATFGETVQCVRACSSCGEQLDLEFAIRDLLHPAYGRRGPVFEAELGGHVVRFRLPTGADQEAASRAAVRDGVERAGEDLIRACVLSVSGPDGAATARDRLPGEVVLALSGEISRCDPQAELTVVTTCAVCGDPVESLFDSFAFLRSEVGSGRGLLTEVHRLASYYHWSERDILALPTRRRRAYLSLREEALAGGRS
ncbi:MAG: hypothetical protein R3B57_03485 [Phycisphaerales bacterium]